MAIDATEHDVGGGMHRLDTPVALIASGTFRIGLRLRLIDQVAGRDRRWTGDRCFRWNGGRWTVTGGGILRDGQSRGEKEETQKTFNVQRPTFNVQWKSVRTHFLFFSAVRILAEKILISSSVSRRSRRTRFAERSSTRATRRSQRLISLQFFETNAEFVDKILARFRSLNFAMVCKRRSSAA